MNAVMLAKLKRVIGRINGWGALSLSAILLGFCVSIYFQSLDGPRPVIRFEYRADSDVLTRWDFDRNEGWVTEDRVRWTLAASREFVREEVMIPQWPAKKMKVNFDPIDGEIEFRNLQLIYAGDQDTIVPIKVNEMKPVAETDAYETRKDGFMITMKGEKVPSVGWSMKNYKAAWDYRIFQAPFLSRFLRSTLLFFLCGAAIWGPNWIQLRPKSSPNESSHRSGPRDDSE